MYEFTLKHEIGACPGTWCSLQPHWPRGKSGVTIGPGYDIKLRTSNKVVEHLTSAGILDERAKDIAKAVGKSGKQAKEWVNSHKDIRITREQEENLFHQVLVPEYENAIQKRVDSRFGEGTWNGLGQEQKAMLFDIKYNAGVRAFPKFTKAVVEKDWQTALKEYKRKGGKSVQRRNANFKKTFLDPRLATPQPPVQPPTVGVWNLTDMLSQPGQSRQFVPPLGGFNVDKSAYTNITEYYDGKGQTSDVVLTIDIDSSVIDDPFSQAIRLNAISQGFITFQPADEKMGDRLTLNFLNRFGFLSTEKVKWWSRWLEAETIPESLIYEQVDKDHLANMLRNLPLDKAANSGMPYFPTGVTAENKDAFINNFLTGNPNYYLMVEPGDYIGQAAPAPLVASNQLSLHARYWTLTEDVPEPMNPRELLYLLFGDDSNEAKNHPLLQKLNDVGLTQTDIHPLSKRMLLRPPLRTWARVMWEAEQEKLSYPDHWKPSGSLGPDRFYNDHARNDPQGAMRRFNDGPYKKSFKCNLFVSDICLRAGFRICIHPVGRKAGNKRWHYIDANSYTNLAHREDDIESERVYLKGRIGKQTSVWGSKIENWLRAQPVADRQRLLNEALVEEGRCFILVGARARRFVKRTLPGGAKGIADCSYKTDNKIGSLRRKGIGHIVLVKEVLDQPVLTATQTQGLQKIKVQTVEASGAGAVSREFHARLGGSAGNAAGGTGFIRLHLIELHPGKDPDLQQGLRDLNVRNINRNLLRTANEAARRVKITHKPDGTSRSPDKCCEDSYPTSGGAEADCS